MADYAGVFESPEEHERVLWAARWVDSFRTRLPALEALLAAAQRWPAVPALVTVRLTGAAAGGTYPGRAVGLGPSDFARYNLDPAAGAELRVRGLNGEPLDHADGKNVYLGRVVAHEPGQLPLVEAVAPASAAAPALDAFQALVGWACVGGSVQLTYRTVYGPPNSSGSVGGSTAVGKTYPAPYSAT